jgi:membrane protein
LPPVPSTPDLDQTPPAPVRPPSTDLSPRPARSSFLSRRRHRLRRRWKELRCLSVIVARELIRTRAVDSAAGLAFWAMLSLVPLLMTVIALISFLPVSSLLAQLLGLLAILIPPQSLPMIEDIIATLLTPHRGVLSFALLSYVWSSIGGFTSLIAALNIAYDVEVERSWLRNRLQALLLTFTSGGLISVSLLALVAGPHFGHLLGQIVSLPALFENAWPFIRLATVFICFVVALELVYFLAPNRKQRFLSTLPGAILAISFWFSGSAALSYYLDHLTNEYRLYGGMAAVIGLMLWMYLTAFAILVGAEANAELAKRKDKLFRAKVQAPSRTYSIRSKRARSASG